MRDILYKTINIDADNSTTIDVFDPMSCDFSKFEWTNGFYLHKVTQKEILKPYVISDAYYGTSDYEDLILLINNIDDPFSMYPGVEIKIPKIEDLKVFILKNRIG
jgi:hypothetical protein